MDIIIRVRRIDVAAVVSIIAHLIFFAIPMRQRPVETVGGSAPAPMTVHLVDAAPAATEAPSTPLEAAPPIVALRPPVAPRPSREAPTLARPVPTPAPLPIPTPQPSAPRTSEPPVDMLAAVNARREARQAAEAAAARGPRAPSENEIAMANIQRNLKNPGEGVGGVFQILSKGTRTAEFAFNGWRPDTEKRWREVIEVDAGLGGDVDRAIVKRMIELIRTHYKGDFKWESHNLGRTVVLSARPEDNDGLEDFLIREFFGTPTVAPARR
jgi:hypothetical protein